MSVRLLQTIAGSSSTFASGTGVGGIINSVLSGGLDQTGTNAITVGELDTAYQLFADSETVDINLVMAGSTQVGTSGVRWCNTRH